jgi:hypothetical protein
MEFPRHVHKPGAHLSVGDDDAYQRAIRDGWSPDPVAVTVMKGDDTWIVYTADSLATALAEGWTVSIDTDAAFVTAEQSIDDAPIVDAPARMKRSKR